MHRTRWSDLEFVLAVAREGSAAAAARVLNVNHTTVMRRIRAFEARLSDPIFEHLATGYRLTKHGEAYLEAARSIETTLSDLDRKVASTGAELAGTVSLTTTDSIFPALIPTIAEMRAVHPEINLEILVTNSRLDLFNRDVDIAIRPSPQPPPDLIGRRVGELGFGAYAVPQAGAPTVPADLRWLGLEEPLASSVPGHWFQAAIGSAADGLKADSFVSLLGLAESGLGCAILPCHLGDGSPNLRRVLRDQVDFSVDMWLLTHRDILRSRRVRACSDFLFKALRGLAPRFRGNAADT